MIRRNHIRSALIDLSGALAFLAVFLVLAAAETYLALLWTNAVAVAGYLLKEKDADMGIHERAVWVVLLVVIAALTGMFYAGWPPAPEGAITF